MPTISLNFILEMLYEVQPLILAYYKKSYVSGGNYPPLAYDVNLFGHMIRKQGPNTPLATFHVSPDTVSKVSLQPKFSPGERGRFYKTGIGWITPDRHEERIRLVLSPGRRLFIKHEYLVPKHPNPPKST